MNHVGYAIKNYRAKYNMSQAELGSLVGVGQSAVGMWEIGSRIPPTKKLPDIAYALHCTVDDLLRTDYSADAVPNKGL